MGLTNESMVDEGLHLAAWCNTVNSDEDGWHLAKHFYKSIFSGKVRDAPSQEIYKALQHHSNAQYFVGKASTKHHGRVTSREECKFYSTKARRVDATQEVKEVGVYESRPRW
ncbi:hypothetical protein EDB83DRAFT_2316560 [Lactarius deliciosus]|nr:hypothetical protein EDB83DRAFT_2316560 [Lactarius deliciosus]